jgi:TolB-like protein/Flp pilus assembly protein TadD
MSALLERLRRRKLVQWGLAYLAGAWVMLEVLSQVGEHFAWSNVALRLLTVALALGFLPALVLAWYHGEQGRQRVTGPELMILTVLLLTACGVLWLVGRPGGVAVLPAAAAADMAIDAGDVAHDKSIAVLPFANLSTNEENAFFASGIHDELLTQLAQIADLKVISRTSVMAYKDSKKSLREIARELGVATVLEGSVQRSGNRVRVQAQLIDARTDGHLWANRFDRELTDVFEIQSEIAREIANALNARLSAGEERSLGKKLTNSTEAYDLYLRARNIHVAAGGTRVDLASAISLLERAIALDPAFAAAHATLSMVHGRIRWYGYDAAPIHLERQKAAAETAVGLDPELADAHGALAYYHYWGRRDYARALVAFGEASRLAPGDATFIAARGYVARRQGKLVEALEPLERAAVLDPLNVQIRTDGLAGTNEFLRRFSEAIRQYDRGLVIEPNYYDAKVLRGWAYFDRDGQLDTLRAALYGNAAPEGNYEIEAWGKFRLEAFARRYDDLLRVARAAPDVMTNQSVYLVRPLLVGHAQKLRGDMAAARVAYDSARVMLEQALHEQPHDPRVLASLGLAQAGLGRNAEARRLARRVQLAMPQTLDYSRWRNVAWDAAEVYAQAGAHDEAIDQLSELMRLPTGWSTHALRANPMFDPLRGDPRFQALLARGAAL